MRSLKNPRACSGSINILMEAALSSLNENMNTQVAAIRGRDICMVDYRETGSETDLN